MHQRGRNDRVVKGVGVGDGDWDGAWPLATDAPIRAGLDHSVDPIPTPARNPLHLVNLRQHLAPQLICFERNEPLVSCSNDYRLVTAPAVGVAGANLIGLRVERGSFLGRKMD